MIKEFKEFILRGNVVDLAVGVVIGGAFTLVVTSFIGNILTPLLGLFNLPNFSTAYVKAGDAKVMYGLFLNALIAFVSVAAVIFFFVVKPVNHLKARGQKETEPANKQCPHCLSEIPREARVCAACTREVAPVA